MNDAYYSWGDLINILKKQILIICHIHKCDLRRLEYRTPFFYLYIHFIRYSMHSFYQIVVFSSDSDYFLTNLTSHLQYQKQTVNLNRTILLSILSHWPTVASDRVTWPKSIFDFSSVEKRHRNEEFFFFWYHLVWLLCWEYSHRCYITHPHDITFCTKDIDGLISIRYWQSLVF